MATAVKTMLKSPTFGKFYFDAVFSTDHRSDVTLTEHPVQKGASVNDHAIVKPDTVTIDIGMYDTKEDAGENHSVCSYATLKAMLETREPIKLVTRLKVYENMVITALSTVDDYTTMNGLRAMVTLTNVNIVTVSTVKVTKQTSGSKKGGSSGGGKKKKKKGGGSKDKDTKQSQDPDQSILKKIRDKLKKKKK